MAPTILIVEDNRDNREIICEFLASYGFETVTAENGQEGIEKFKRHGPDLALVDVLLPRINGLKVCEMIKNSEQGARTPVIMMSALYKTYGLQQEAKQKYGADEYLLKPLNLMGLVETICKHLNLDKATLIEQARTRQDIPLTGTPRAIKTPPMSGSLSEHPPLDVLIWMRDGGLTGTYIQTFRNARRTIYVLEGSPVYVSSNLLSETLGKILVAEGKISEDELASADDEAKNSNKPLSSALVKLGLLDKAELTNALLNETYTRFINALGWFSGEYVVREDASWIEQIKRPKVPFEQLVHQGIKRHYPDDMISRELQPAMTFRIDKVSDKLDLVGALEWDVEELETFALIDGERTFTEIQALSNQPIETNHRILFTLFKLGIITFI